MYRSFKLPTQAQRITYFSSLKLPLTESSACILFLSSGHRPELADTSGTFFSRPRENLNPFLLPEGQTKEKIASNRLSARTLGQFAG